uniref:Ig-like domain-containing protein n=1 Tax=Strongyloides papillosus TaxID=174720 RepID=A0A0N5B5S6_STREA
NVHKDDSKKAPEVKAKPTEEKPKDEIKKDDSKKAPEVKAKPTEEKPKDEIKKDDSKKALDVKAKPTDEKNLDEVKNDVVDVSMMSKEDKEIPTDRKYNDEVYKDFVDLSDAIIDLNTKPKDDKQKVDSEDIIIEQKLVEKVKKTKSKDSRDVSKKKSKIKDKSSNEKGKTETSNDKEKNLVNNIDVVEYIDIEDKKYNGIINEEDSNYTSELSSDGTADNDVNETIKIKELGVENDKTVNQPESDKSKETNFDFVINDNIVIDDKDLNFINKFDKKLSKEEILEDYNDYEEVEIKIKKRQPRRGFALRPSSKIYGKRGDTITLECELYHEDDIVSWKYNNSCISDFRMTIKDMPYFSKLIFKDVLPSDSNSIVEYTTNDGENDISYQSCLQIDEIPIDFVKYLERKYNGEENGSIEISVELTYATDNFNWFINKHKIIESEKYKLSVINNIYILHIGNLKYDDCGLIEFVVNNGPSCCGNLEIYGKPIIIDKMNNERNITGDIDDSITHTWNIQSHPEPDCEVYFNDNIIDLGIRFNVEVFDNKILLTKRNASRKDNGEYKLRVFNKYGEDYDIFHIFINDVPLPPSSLYLNSIENESIIISWSLPENSDESTILGYVIEIKEADRRVFKKVGQTSGNDLEYIIENLDINTEYLIRVAAKNKYGISEFTEPIMARTNSPYKAPIITSSPIIKNIINNSCELEWEECTDNGGSEIYCYDVFGNENDKEWFKINSSPIFTCNFIVRGLKYSDDENLINYKFKIEATNGAGMTSKCDLVSETITMSKKISKPKKITNVPVVTIVSCDSVTVDWICSESPEDCPSYIVYYKNEDSGTDTWKSIKATSPPVLINELKEGISYIFKVCGENNEGEGECSEICKSVRMLANESPLFTKMLRNVSIAKKSSLQLECHAIGEPSPSYIWYHNNDEIIPSETNDYEILIEGFSTTLKVDRIKEKHSGEYKCIAINEHGEDETKCKLSVVEVRAHFVSTFPEFITIEEGSTFELVCELSDDDACVTWFKNGKRINESAIAKYDIIVDGPFRILRVKEATIFDSCDYTCVTSEGRRAMGEVEVFEKPPYIEIGPQDYTVTSFGETVKLSCITSAPARVVKWYKNGKEVWPQSGKIFMNKEDCLCYLDIYDFNERDIGEYNVVIGSDCDDISAPAHINMLVQPEIKIISYNGDSEIHVGKDLFIQVEINGVPKPKLLVTLNNENIKLLGGKIEEYENEATIRLTHLERMHNGILKLIAENDVGIEEKGSIINVIDIPSPPTNLRISDIRSTKVKLTWEYPKDDGGCQIDYLLVERKTAEHTRWRVIHRLKSFKEQYLVEDLYPDVIYAFRIVAVNDVGRSDSSNVVDCITLDDDSEDVSLIETFIVDQFLQPPNRPNIVTNGFFAEVLWDEIILADEYVVERKEEDDQLWIELCVTDKCHYQDRSCRSTGRYFYRISSKSGNKRSLPGEETEFVFLLPVKVSEKDDSSDNQISENTDNMENEQGVIINDTINKNENNDIDISQIESKDDTKLLKEEPKINIESTNEEPKTDVVKKKKVVKKLKKKKEVVEEGKSLVKEEEIKEVAPVDTEKLEVFENETSIVVESGCNTKLISYLKSGTPIDSKWYKNDQEKTPDCYVTFDKESIYSIKKASEIDCGVYKCVWYDSSTTIEQTFNVSIKGVPTLDICNSTVEIKSGTSGKLYANYNGCPEPKISWFFNDKEIGPNNLIKIVTKTGESTLLINDALEEYAGIYTVNATNEHGSVDKQIQLNIYGPPSSPTGPLVVTKRDENSVTLSWNQPTSDGGSTILGYCVEKKETTKSSWIFVDRTTQTNFTIKELKNNVKYDYRVSAENKFGTGSYLESSTNIIDNNEKESSNDKKKLKKTKV